MWRNISLFNGEEKKNTWKRKKFLRNIKKTLMFIFSFDIFVSQLHPSFILYNKKGRLYAKVNTIFAPYTSIVSPFIIVHVIYPLSTFMNNYYSMSNYLISALLLLFTLSFSLHTFYYLVNFTLTYFYFSHLLFSPHFRTINISHITSI